MSETENVEQGASGAVEVEGPAREAFHAAYPHFEKLLLACLPEGKQCLFFSAGTDLGDSAMIFAQGEEAEQDLRAAWAIVVAIRDFRSQGREAVKICIEVLP